MKRFKFIDDSTIVMGHSRSLILDFTRNKYHLIPNSLADIISKFDKSTIESVIENYGVEHKDTINEYFLFLEQNDLIFYPNDEVIDNFVKVDFTFHHPSVISNCIFDLSKLNISYFQSVILELDKYGCKAIQIRTQENFDFSVWENLLKVFDESTFTTIEVICPSSINNSYWVGIVSLFKRIKSVFIYNANSTEYLIPDNSHSQVVFQSEIDLPDLKTCCGNISKYYFNVNISLFSESQEHNTCLNKKISVDDKGMIKNCPSMVNSYGNVSNTSLSEVINNSNFKELWDIKKDSIDICKHCEFRHICTDCRAYLQEPNNVYSKPLKCGYNPYTNEWEKWSENPLNLIAIKHYNLKEIMY